MWAGLLEPIVESVNMVNAPVVAQDHDIDVAEVRHDRPGDYQTLIRVTVTTENRKRDVAGTLFANGHPRLVQVKGIGIEAEVTPHMLYITNRDVSDILGFLGQTLGDAELNIATFNLGRAKAGDDAIAMISVDQQIPPPILAVLRGHEGIRQAVPLRF